MKIGILVFGNGGFPADAVIDEFKRFMETNSRLKLNIVVGKYPQLPVSEVGIWNAGTPSQCYFVSPWSLSAASKSLLPSDSACNIVLWNNEGLGICWAGGTWGEDNGINGVPFISIPFGWAPIEPWGPWAITYSQALVHEFIHALTITLGFRGYSVPNSADNCGSMGYDSGCAAGYTCDPGWTLCYKALLAQITDPMYTVIDSHYECVNNVCTKIQGPGTYACPTISSPCGTTTSPLQCSPACTPTQYCVLGTCLEKKYLSYGILGFGTVLLLAVVK